VTDVLLASTAYSPLNLNNRDRFRVLMDKFCPMGAYNNVATTAVADRTVQLVKKYLKLNLETIFDGTSAAIGDIQTGAIFMLCIGTNGVAAGSSLGCQIRLRFVDA